MLSKYADEMLGKVVSYGKDVLKSAIKTAVPLAIGAGVGLATGNTGYGVTAGWTAAVRGAF
jgi:hypothetical protein